MQDQGIIYFGHGTSVSKLKMLNIGTCNCHTPSRVGS